MDKFSIQGIAEHVEVFHTGKCAIECIERQLGIEQNRLISMLIEMRNHPTAPKLVKDWCERLKSAVDRANGKAFSLNRDCWLNSNGSKCS